MKSGILALAILATTLTTGARADLNYPWCAQYGGDGGALNCGFSTYAQCMATVSGTGGFCEQNTTYVPIAPAVHSTRKRRS